MKLSVWVFATDLITSKRSYFDKWVKKNIFDDSTTSEVFAKLKASGIDGIELLIPLHFTNDDLRFIQKILSENNIQVNTIHQPLRLFSKTDLKEIQKLFIIADKLKAKVIVLHLNSAGNQIYNKNYLKNLHELEKKYNVQIGFENHQKHFILACKEYLWDSKKFSKLLQSIHFGMTLDTTHLATTGKNIVSFLQENINNIVNIHLSDYKSHLFSTSFRPAASTHMPLGDGELPIVEFLEFLKEKKYNGFITLEINTDLEKLCTNAQTVKSVIGKKH